MHNNIYCKQVITKKLTVEDYNDVAAIHLLAFKDSFLTILGTEVLNRYYQWQSASPNECYPIGAFYQNQLVGFCFAGDFPDTELGFIRHNLWLIAKQVIGKPHILVDKRFLEKAKYTFAIVFNHLRSVGKRKLLSHKRQPKFGILAIATHPNFQGSGIGKCLMTEAETTALEHGYTKMRLSVHPGNSKAVSFYEKSGWHKVYTSSAPWEGYMEKDLAAK